VYAPVVNTWASGETMVTLHEDGMLRVSGTGDMGNYGYNNNPPWQHFKNRINAVVIEKGVTSVGNYVFSGFKNIKSVTIPNSVISVGSNAFNGCKSLTSLTIPNSVLCITNNTFSNCSSLTFINVGKGNKRFRSINGVLFAKNMEKLTLVRYPAGRFGAYTIPSNVTNIQYGAFLGSVGLTSITIPSSVELLQEEPFAEHCIGLTSINVDDDNPQYSSIDGVLFNKDATTLIRYPEGKKGAYAIPNGVTKIRWGAFLNCTGLTSAAIPNSVTSIEQEAFAGTSLTSIKIPGSVTSIGAAAFGFCKALTYITIPSSVTSIGELAFDFCDNLTSVTSLNPIPPDVEHGEAFRGLSEDAILYVPKGSIDTYRSADAWNEFKYIKPIESYEKDKSTKKVSHVSP